MLCIVTDIHDVVALEETCQRLGLPPPHEGGTWLDGGAASGWVVSLPGLHAPVVCDTLSGLVAYHPHDNSHKPYARIMRFVFRYYDVRAQLRQRSRAGRKFAGQHDSRVAFVEEVA